MADLGITIKALDQGARQLIRDLVAALGSLKKAGEAVTGSSARREAKAEAQALQERLALSQTILRVKQEEVARLEQLRQRNIASAEKEKARLIQVAQEQAVANEAAARRQAADARAAADAVASAANTEIANQRALIRAVEQGVQERIASQSRLAAVEATSNAARTLAETQRLERLQQVALRERRINEDRIADAKRLLTAAQQQVTLARTNVKATPAGTAARTAAEASLAVAKSTADQRKQALTDLQATATAEAQINRRRIEDQQILIDQQARFAAARANVNKNILAGVQAEGQAEINVAKTSANAVIESEQKKIAAKNAEAAAAQKNVNKVIAQGAQLSTAATKQGNQQVAAAKKAGQAQLGLATASAQAAQKNVVANQKAANAATKAANQQAGATKTVTSALTAQAKKLPTIEDGMRRIRRAILAVTAAYGGFRSILGFVKIGFDFNQIIESSRLGIAALITAEADLVSAQGKLLTGTDALAAAQGLAGKQLDKLRIAGLQTTATTEELVQAFQEAVGAGVSVGLTLDQIRTFSVQVAQAATAINLPMNQLQQETRSILQGTIDRNSRIAKALLLTNEQVRLAKEQGRLAEFLNEKFQAFNVAGVASVQTMSALKSNIKDALSVFSGIAVRPLFEQLRAAGQDALSKIFDFKTADISDNFRGLIEALQEIFRQVGQVFGFTIRSAIEKASVLSRWLRENKDQVRQTAAAISTMVREFINMIGAVVRGVAEMITFGGHVNTVADAARTLSAIFQTIAENIKFIVGMLAARSLVTAIVRIVAAVVALRGTLTGAAIGSTIAPGVGTAIGAVLGTVLSLSLAYKLLKGDQQAARLEAARLGNAFSSQQLRGVELLGTLIDLDRQIAGMKKANEDTTEVEQQRLAVEEQLRALGPEYAKAIDAGTGSLEERRKKLIDLIQQQRIFAAFQLAAAQSEQKRLEAERARLVQQGPKRTVTPASFRGGPAKIEIDTSGFNNDLKKIDDALEVNRQAVETAGEAYRKFATTVEGALKTPARVRPKKQEEPDLGEPPEIREARARFEVLKAELDAERAKLDAEFAAQAISSEQHAESLLQLNLQEIDGERTFIEAEIAEADRRKAIAQRAGKQGIKQVQEQEDAIRGFLVQLVGLTAKETQAYSERDQAVLSSAQETAKRRLEIEAKYARASGDVLKASQLDIQNKQEEALRDAIQTFGDDATKATAAAIEPGRIDLLRDLIASLGKDAPPVLIHAAFVIDQQSIKEQVEAIEQQVKDAQETANREVEAIKAHFKSIGPLTSGQRQDQADQITAANERAKNTVATLKTALLDLQKTAKDPAVLLLIKTILAIMDGISARAKKVDLDMQQLIQGFEKALQGGITEFFDTIVSGSQEGKNAFHEMIVSIINDMRHLLSELIAKKITSAIFKVLGLATGAAEGGQAGNQTQSGGRAQGGLALQGRAGGGIGRPPHGVLHGGIPGKDSIPIAAMPDEYFVKRQATNYYGADLLDLFNEMRVPRTWARELFTLMHHHFTPPVIRERPRFRYSQGGAVGRQTATARPSLPIGGATEHTITVDADGLLRFLQGSKGRGITLSHVASAPKFINRSLGPSQKRVGFR
jgi:hypothetical protein